MRFGTLQVVAVYKKSNATTKKIAWQVYQLILAVFVSKCAQRTFAGTVQRATLTITAVAHNVALYLNANLATQSIKIPVAVNLQMFVLKAFAGMALRVIH